MCNLLCDIAHFLKAVIENFSLDKFMCFQCVVRLFYYIVVYSVFSDEYDIRKVV